MGRALEQPPDPGQDPGAPQGSTRLALSASEQGLIGIAYAAYLLTIEGWWLFDEQRRQPAAAAAS